MEPVPVSEMSFHISNATDGHLPSPPGLTQLKNHAVIFPFYFKLFVIGSLGAMGSAQLALRKTTSGQF